jgi:hypothetical protein
VYFFPPCGSTAKLWALAASMKLSVSFQFLDLRTVGRTPSMGDQLVARPLLTAPGECDDDKVGGMKRFFWQEKPKYSEKTCPDATLSTTNSTCQTRA